MNLPIVKMKRTLKIDLMKLFLDKSYQFFKLFSMDVFSGSDNNLEIFFQRKLALLCLPAKI